MQLCLDRAKDFLALQSPKEYVQQLAAASEALRRSRITKARFGGDGATELEEFRKIFNEGGG